MLIFSRSRSSAIVELMDSSSRLGIGQFGACSLGSRAEVSDGLRSKGGGGGGGDGEWPEEREEEEQLLGSAIVVGEMIFATARRSCTYIEIQVTNLRAKRCHFGSP